MPVHDGPRKFTTVIFEVSEIYNGDKLEQEEKHDGPVKELGYDSILFICVFELHKTTYCSAHEHVWGGVVDFYTVLASSVLVTHKYEL